MHPCPSSHLPTLALSTQMCGWLSSEIKASQKPVLFVSAT